MNTNINMDDDFDYIIEDRQVAFRLVQNNGLDLSHVSDELKNDRDVVFIAVNKNGLALQYASDELKNDKELVLIAVQGNGSALKYASNELKNDVEIVEAAIDMSSLGFIVGGDVEDFLYAGAELKNNDDYIISMSYKNINMFKFASYNSRDNENIILNLINHWEDHYIENKKLICKMMKYKQLSDIYNSIDYIAVHGYLSERLKNLVDVNDFKNSLMKLIEKQKFTQSLIEKCDEVVGGKQIRKNKI